MSSIPPAVVAGGDKSIVQWLDNNNNSIEELVHKVKVQYSAQSVKDILKVVVVAVAVVVVAVVCNRYQNLLL